MTQGALFRSLVFRQPVESVQGVPKLRHSFLGQTRKLPVKLTLHAFFV